MRRTKVSESIGYISDKYVNEATLYTGKVRTSRHKNLLKWGAAAACFVAAIAVYMFIQQPADKPAPLPRKARLWLRLQISIFTIFLKMEP